MRPEAKPMMTMRPAYATARSAASNTSPPTGSNTASTPLPPVSSNTSRRRLARRAGIEVQPVGHDEAARLGRRDLLGEGAGRDLGDDAIAALDARHLRARARDEAGHVAAGNERPVGTRLVFALQHQRVGKVEADRLDLDQHLVVLDGRCRHLFDAVLLERAELVHD